MNFIDSYRGDFTPEVQKFKGHAQLDLLRNGKVIQRVEQDNAITAALANLMKNTYLHTAAGIGRPFSANDYFGGCFLLDGEIPFEDGVPPTILPSGLNVTAHAGQTPNNSETIVKRGSPNKIESYEGDNNSFTFVWDWRTSEGNGPISSVALTHSTNGYNGIGTNEVLPIVTLLGPTNSGMSHDVDAVLIKNNNTYLRFTYADRKFTIEERIKCINTLRFNDNRLLSTHEVATTINFPMAIWQNKACSFDGDYAYFFNWALNTNKLYCCKISLVEFTAEDITFTLPFNIDRGGGYQNKWAVEGIPVHKGYLYYPHKSGVVYKVNLSNVADTKALDNPDGLFIPDIAVGVDCKKFGDLLLWSTNTYARMFYQDKFLMAPYDPYTWSDTNYAMPAACSVLDGASYSINAQNGLRVQLAPNFITTALNLDNPVTKSPDMTMKLTYTIREV